MQGGKRIIDIRGETPEQQDLQDEGLLLDISFADPADDAALAAPIQEGEVDAEPVAETAHPRRFGWFWPAIAILAGLIWMAGLATIAGPGLLRDLAPAAIIQFASAILIGPAFIGIVWLLAMRTSRAEAHRFGATASAMRDQARALEAALASLSARVDANGQLLAAQAERIDGAAERASQRLAATTNAIAQEIARADSQAATLTQAAIAAQDALGVLLASLPRAHEETAAIGQMLEAAGLAASAHAAGLAAQLGALAEQGRIADAVTGAAAQKLAAHIARMEATSETASARLEQVTGAMSESVDALLVRTADAADEARKGITAQGDAMRAMVEANQAALDRASRVSVEALSGRISAIEQVIDRIAVRLTEEQAAGDTLARSLDRQFQIIEARIGDFHKNELARTQMLAASISALGGSADAMIEALNTGEATARKVINTSEDLLTSLDAAAREIDETLPEALARLDARIADSRSIVAGTKPELLALVTAAESTHDAIEAIAHVIQGQRTTLDQLSSLLNDVLTAGRERAAAIDETLDGTISRTQNFAEKAAPQLIDALIRVRDTASTAADRARETLVGVIPDAARQIEIASAEAMRRALGNAVERQLAAIATAAEEAVGTAQRASNRLAEQMLTIAETTALVDHRIEEARDAHERQETESLGRRSSLLIEAMNSAAIDIAKAFSAEIADSAWAAYLKGDRGVFTRRAVRLLDAAEARDIARLHDQDAGFREHVNRYIHDFEAMLRTILAQRDGAPMGVTLLSSDMGKLYVALAQAIERLRT